MKQYGRPELSRNGPESRSVTLLTTPGIGGLKAQTPIHSLSFDIFDRFLHNPKSARNTATGAYRMRFNDETRLKRVPGASILNLDKYLPNVLIVLIRIEELHCVI